MFKTNLQITPKYLFLIVIALIIILGFVLYFSWPREKVQEPEGKISEEIETGGVGEIEEGKTLAEVNPQAISNPVRPPGTLMPAVVFNTSGTIISVEEDGLTVKGNGSNFEDQKSRTLNIKFTDKTITTITFEEGNPTRYQGKGGLKYLSPADRILIESSENIRGKTEFTASYINKR